jgi:hypothetical protein
MTNTREHAQDATKSRMLPDTDFKVQYGVLCYRGTLNLGDEIQSLAAAQFLPSIDDFVDRESLRDYSGDPIKLIMNGWYMHQPGSWPPAPQIIPLLASIHISEEISPQNVHKIPPGSTMLNGVGREFFRKHGPVGARDRNTVRLLSDAGIDSYFSGCMTFTFPTYLGLRTENVYCVDVDDEIFLRLKESALFDLHRLSHWEFDNNRLNRFTKAGALLDLYRRARLVITGRLHCALPCLAFGTPVVFVETAHDRYRFNGLREFLHCVPRDNLTRDVSTWWSGDFEQNKPDFTPYRARLIAAVARFAADARQVAAAGKETLSDRS